MRNKNEQYIPIKKAPPKEKLESYKMAERKLWQALSVAELLSDSDIENVEPYIVLDTVKTIRDLLSNSLDILVDL